MVRKQASKKPVLPPYNKPYNELKRAVVPGQKVSVKVRILNFKTGAYELRDEDFTVVENAVNCMVVRERAAGIPWYAIHDWELVNL